jgi:hypothetical protein
MHELTQHHVGGLLKVAPEHTDPDVLNRMRKPAIDNFDSFAQQFADESRRAGKKQYLVPYFIASHPGSDLNAMIELALFLKRNGYRPDQVQDFIPAPLDVATSMYYTGIDPFTNKPVHIARSLRERKLQRALMQFFKPENYFEVRQALREAGRADLIGAGCDCLIPASPPREAIERRRTLANKRFQGEYVHQIDGPEQPVEQSSPVRRSPGKRSSRHAPGSGYRPNRSEATGRSSRRQNKRGGAGEK